MSYTTHTPISDAQLLHEGTQQGLTQAESVEIKSARRKETQIKNEISNIVSVNLMGKKILLSRSRYMKLSNFCDFIPRAHLKSKDWDWGVLLSELVNRAKSDIRTIEYQSQIDWLLFESDHAGELGGTWIHPILVLYLMDHVQGASFRARLELLLEFLKEPQVINLFNALDLSSLKNKEYNRVLDNTLTITFI